MRKTKEMAVMPISPSVPRVALITGGAVRLGAAITRMLAEQGFDVAVHYNKSAKEARALRDELKSRGRAAEIFQADLSQEESPESLMSAVRAKFGAVGILINNAAVFKRDEVENVSSGSWEMHMQVNLRAPFQLSQIFAAALPEKAEGIILNLLDQRVWNLTPHFISYTLSKSGLWTLTRTLALALAPRIRVNALGPGPVLPSKGQTPESFQKMTDGLPLLRSADPAEVARAALALCALPSVTGQMIALDGGNHLKWR